jgi:hypothetical protein
VLLGLGFAAGLFGALEVAARVQQRWKMAGLPTYKPRHVFDFSRFYRVNPDYRSRNVRVNSAGFRNDEETTEEKPPNVYRIVLLGGSQVWGEDSSLFPDVTIDNRETIAAHLENVLNERAAKAKTPRRFQVVNAGVVGYRLYQELTYFDQRIAAFHPDMLIAIDGHNDLDALDLGLPPYTHRNEAGYERALNHPTLFDLARQIERYAEEWSLFVRKVAGRLSDRVNESRREQENAEHRGVSDDAFARWLADYCDTVLRLNASAQIAGARALFVVQPEALAERAKPLTPVEKQVVEHWGNYRWLHTVARDRLIGAMRNLAHDRGVWFEDVSDLFSADTEQVYLDYTHLTSTGALRFATRLADVIQNEAFQCDSRTNALVPGCSATVGSSHG